MFSVGDSVRWGTDLGTVTKVGDVTTVVKFASGSVDFFTKNGKFYDGRQGVGDALILVEKAGKKKIIKLYRWEKQGVTSTGKPFLKQTEGLYDEAHAKDVLTGYVKIISSERTIEVE